MLTGPYYSYRTFNDMLTGWPANAPGVSLDPFYRRLQEAPFFGVAYFFSSYFFSISHVRSPGFQDHGYGYRFGYMVVIFFVYRMRIYFAWLMAECACMAAGLGAYPALSKPQVGEGPTDLRTLDEWMTGLNQDSSAERTEEESIDLDSASVDLQDQEALDDFYTFDTVRTVSVWQCEFSPTIREGMKAWNMTVQHWLSKTIYLRCPGPRLFRSFVTMMMSAFWHGVEPGYYLAFLPIPFAMLAEDGIATVVVSFFGSSLPPGTVSLLRWLFKMRIFEYFAMAFLLLDAPSILTYWASLNYVMHILIAVLLFLHLLLFKFVSPLALKTVLHPQGPPKLRASYKIHKLVEEEDGEEDTSRASDWMAVNSYGNSVGTRNGNNADSHYL
ncbi:Lysophospholipid acyltransferase 7 [Sparganum proliferum]